MKSIITSVLFSVASLAAWAQVALSPVEFQKAVNDDPNGILLDVRTADEFESGHLSGALQADWSNKAQFQERVSALEKEKTVYIYCFSGGRSGAAQQWLLANGFTSVINMKGGIYDWNLANLPVEGTKTVPQLSKTDFLTSLPKDEIVLVDISAEWCPPCKKMTPVVDSLIAEGYTVLKIDGGAQKQLCKDLKVYSFPTFVVYKNGEETNRKQGIFSVEGLKAILNEKK